MANFTLTNKALFNIASGGSVGIALGGEYRREKATFSPDALVASGDVQGFTTGAATGGSYNVKELFAEIDVPVFQGRPLAQLLDFNAAARYSDYSTQVGSVFTYSAGGIYRPIADVGFRGQYQRAIRAPNVNELFQGATQQDATAPDPCNLAAPGSPIAALCVTTGVPTALIGTPFSPRPQYFVINGGSTSLREERSSTYTGGIVLTPSFIPRLTLSADYYHISIDGYLGNIGAANILNLCYTGETDFCGRIGRNPLSGEIATVDDRTANSGGFKTSGVDVSLAYNLPLGGGLFGGNDSRLIFNSQVTRLINRVYTPVSAIPDTRNSCAGKFGVTCGQPFPHWRAVSRVSLVEGPVTTSVQWQYLGPSTDDGSLGYQVAVPRLPAKSYIDLATSVRVNDRFTFAAGVNNLFDVEPTILGDNDQLDTANTYPAFYDVIGRRFFVSVTAKIG